MVGMADVPVYVVTGGAGFIGSALVAALLARQPRPHVVVVDDFRCGTFSNIVEACRRRGVGAFDGTVIPRPVREVWKRVYVRGEDRVAGPDVGCPKAVFHLAAITDTTMGIQQKMLEDNLAGWREMMDWCMWQRVPLVYASSAAVYGVPPQARDRVPFPLDAGGWPTNVYGFSKWLMECEHAHVARAYGGIRPVHIVGLRYFNVFGPGEAHKGRMASMVMQLACQLLRGERPRLFADGTQARDQVYVEDVVEATLAAAGLGQRVSLYVRELTRRGLDHTSPLSPDKATDAEWERAGIVRPGVYNVGSGRATTFNDVLGALRQALGVSESRLPTEYIGMPAAVAAYYQPYTCADLAQTRAGLGWSPRYDPLEAMGTYARWLREAVAAGEWAGAWAR